MSKFRVGDRVSRRADVYDDGSRLMHGTVADVYADTMSRFGPYYELYRVKWDDGYTQHGYLPHGLDPLPVTPTQETPE